MVSLREFMRSDASSAGVLESATASPLSVAIPDIDEVANMLRRLQAPESDIQDAVAAAPRLLGDDEIVSLIEQFATFLQLHMGDIDLDLGLPQIPERFGVLSHFFYLYVFVTGFPAVRRYHAHLGVPDEISLATLSDLGRHLLVNRKRWGFSGLVAPGWMQHHFRGVLYDLGRLQFETVRLGDALAAAISAHGDPAAPTDQALSIHIPDFSGPMTPAAVDDSLHRAKPFFRTYFPGHDWKYAMCSSWLLDEQLPSHLKETSNIVQFQRRFRLVSQGERNDRAVATFIWGARAIPAAPRSGATSLERAVIAHHTAGGHWGSGAGWLELP